MPSESPIEDVTVRVARAFEQVGLDYFLGGSVASSLQGDPRSTNDIDFVVDLSAEDVPRLAQALGDDFEVDEPSLVEAVRRRGSWNIYFLPQLTKIDLFVRGRSEFDESEFSRRRRIDLGPGQSIWIKSPEDTVLRKLLWNQQGGGESRNQWRDVIEVLRVSGPEMDPEYLDRWAARLGIEAALSKARDQAKIAGS